MRIVRIIKIHEDDMKIVRIIKIHEDDMRIVRIIKIHKECRNSQEIKSCKVLKSVKRHSFF